MESQRNSCPALTLTPFLDKCENHICLFASLVNRSHGNPEIDQVLAEGKVTMNFVRSHPVSA